jgi:uncharacterized protein (DUF885 family)
MMHRFKRFLKFAGVLLILLAVMAGALAVNAVYFRPWSIRVFFERAFLRYALDDPELLTTLGLLEQFGIRAHNAKLTDASPRQTKRLQALTRASLATLSQYKTNRLSAQDRLSADVLGWFLRTQIEGQRFDYHDYPVNQFQGAQSQLPEFLTTMHAVKDRRGAGHYLKRLDALPTKWDQLLESLRYREDRGILPPRFVVQRVLTEMREFVEQPAATNPLVRVFAEKVDKLDRVPPEEKAELKRRAEAAVETAVYPAYRRLLDYFAALEPKTTTDDGVWKLPDGAAFYAWILRAQTTTRLTPAEIHELGLNEVARIETEMRAILDAQGHTGGTPGEWLQRLAADGRFLYPNTPAGRQEALAEYKRIVDEVLAVAPKYFNVLPKAGIEVRRVPEFKEATSPAAYYNQPSMDGSRPGIFFVNVRDMAELPKFGMKTLTYHEGVPGHHFQTAIALELQGVPTFRKLGLFTAYSEGWALYAERLGKEAGLYEADPYGDLGRLQDEMLRAVRLVVDTGIHAKRWTRAEAIRYMIEKTGMAEPSVVSEVERYIVAPGQACAYKVGMLKILELRERAKTALGARFDLRAFHDVVLKNGAVPLETLEQLVDGWIRQSAAAAKAS